MDAESAELSREDAGLVRVREGVLGAQTATAHLQMIDESGGEAPDRPDGGNNSVQVEPGGGRRGGGRRGGQGQSAEGATPENTCPLVCLGHRAGEFVFLDAKGQERWMKGGALARRGDLMTLFLGNSEWLFRWFSRKKKIIRTDEEGNDITEEVVIGINIAGASELLMDMCGEAGLFGGRVALRGPGVWVGADGVPIVHAGSRVMIDGKWRKSGFRSGHQVYVAAPVEAAPGGIGEDGDPLLPGEPGFAAPASVAGGLQRTIKRLWKFKSPGADILCVGLMGIGYYGAAARWRSNGFLLGGTGSGKTFLLDLLRACVPAHVHSTDATKSGIEAAIDGRPTGVFIDEAGDRSGLAPQLLLDFVLSASGSEGTKGHRGTADGRGRSFQVLCNVLMACVNPPTMGPQHRDRFTLIELNKPGAGVDHRGEMIAAIARAKEVGPALWGRAIEGWERWQLALEAFRGALARAQCAAREMDQMGAILASWWVLTEDGVPDPTQALDAVGAVGDFIRGADQVAAEDGPRTVVQFLSGTVVQRDRSTDQEQIGTLLEKAFAQAGDEAESAGKWLCRYGIRPIRADAKDDHKQRAVPRMAPGDGMWFAKKAETLRALFRGSPHEGDRWIYEMLRHPSARDSRSRLIRVGGVVGPAIWLSRADWGPPDD